MYSEIMPHFPPHKLDHFSLMRWTQQQCPDQHRGFYDAQDIVRHHLASTQQWPPGQTISLTTQQRQGIRHDLNRYCQGEPLAYILGEWDFWSLTLRVSAQTLIPRPDTETLVTVVLDTLPDGHQKIVDLGTGCGAIALALAKERPHWDILAIDHCPHALAIAKDNAQRLALDHVRFQLSNWLTDCPLTSVDAIVSNPPYLAPDDPHLSTLHHEPMPALISPQDGLEDLFSIVEQAPNYLINSGFLFLEHGDQQSHPIQQHLQCHHYHSIATHADINQKPRVTYAQSK